MEKTPSCLKKGRIIGLLAVSLLLLAGNTAAQRFQLGLFGGIQHVFEYGAIEDYVLGENDFPVTPAHTPAALGASFSVFVTKNLGLEADARYILSSKVKLTDPSDQDSFELDTASHYTLTLNVFYQFPAGDFMLYILAGGGIDTVRAKDAVHISAYGFEITVEAPESKTDPVADFGGGLVYSVNDTLGIRLDVRYAVIFAVPAEIAGLNTALGVVVRF